MKYILLITVLLFSVEINAQRTILEITTPAAANDSMNCTTHQSGGQWFVDYSDLDGDTWIKVGPDAGDGKPVWYTFGSLDSILLDYSTYQTIDGTEIRRKGFYIAEDWEKTCFRIWNIDASADSTIYIYRYQYTE